MPRWRTMIEPAGTSWPSPAFTPSRWPTLSRPFLTLPPAFLWAMGLLVLLGRARLGGASSSARPRPRPASAAFALVVGFFGRRPWRRPWPSVVVSAFAVGFASALAAALVSALAAFGGRLRSARPSWPAPSRAASFAASSASLAAWAAAASSRRWRSVLASASALAAAFAALLPSSMMSLMRRTVSSWRWPFLTRRAGLGAVLERDELLAAILAEDLGADRGAVDERADRSTRRRRRRPAARARA